MPQVYGAPDAGNTSVGPLTSRDSRLQTKRIRTEMLWTPLAARMVSSQLAQVSPSLVEVSVRERVLGMGRRAISVTGAIVGCWDFRVIYLEEE